MIYEFDNNRKHFLFLGRFWFLNIYLFYYMMHKVIMGISRSVPEEIQH
jgi:hypothetical protein